MGIVRMPEPTAVPEPTMKEYNKIVLNGETLIDLTADTITAQSLLKGFTAHGADGKKIVGLYEAAATAGLNATCGEITPTSDRSNYSLSHGLGEVPRAFFIGMQTSYLNLSGKRKVPLPKDLYSEQITIWQFRIFIAAFLVFALGIIIQKVMIIRIGAVLWLIVAVLYNINVFKLMFHKINKTS